MERYEETREDALTDLGAVEVETKGLIGSTDDQQGGLRVAMGLTDD